MLKYVVKLVILFVVFQIVNLQKAWRSGSRSPSYRPTPGALSPDWASPPFPSSPLLHRRTARAVAPLCMGGDGPPLGSVPPFSPNSSPISLESETERLSRWTLSLYTKRSTLISPCAVDGKHFHLDKRRKNRLSNTDNIRSIFVFNSRQCIMQLLVPWIENDIWRWGQV